MAGFCITIVNICIMENSSSIDPDSVFLNPEYLEKIRLQEQMQEHGDELPEDVKKYVEGFLDNPLNKVNSKMF